MGGDVVVLGEGAPCTVFAPGGEGDALVRRLRFAADVGGTVVGFAYGQSSHDGVRRQADRDAADVGLVAAAHGATRAIGFSRGARAVVGALAAGASFARVVLAIPPAGSAAGLYGPWLADRPRPAGVDVLVIGHRGDPAHPVRVATAWADALGGRLEVLPSRAVGTDDRLVMALLTDFLA